MSHKMDWIEKLTLALALGILAVLASYTLSHSMESNSIPPPPDPGTSVTLGGLYIVCDTKEQVADIVSAGRDHKALEAKFQAHNAKTNPKGEPDCAVAQVGRVVIGESEMLGVNMSADGREVNSYAVHFGNQQGDWWMLYGVPTTQGNET